MRTSHAALAIITRINSLGNPEYLTQWNNGWNAYSLIGGHVEEGETFQQCCIREIEEELECGPEQIDVDDVPVCTLRFRELSKAAGVETDYEWQIFVTRIADDRLGRLPATCAWVDAQQARQKVTKDGQPVADQVWRVVSAVDNSPQTATTALSGDNSPSVANSDCQVTWMADAKRDLDEQTCARLNVELGLAFDAKRGTIIVVKQRFRGFSDQHLKKIILAVEVQTSEGSHAGVVKIGDSDLVGGDYTGWQSCAGSRGVTSRLFIAPVRRELGNPPGSRIRQNSDASGSSQIPNSHESGSQSDSVLPHRVAIIYPDVYQYYFDDGRENEPRELETLVERSVLSGRPSAASLDRVLAQVYTEAYRCFYRSAVEDDSREHTLQAVLRSLRVGDPEPVLELWQKDEYLKLRRGAAWLTSVNRMPDSPTRPEYIDPVDYLAWVLGPCERLGVSPPSNPPRSRVRHNSDLSPSTRVPNSDESGYGASGSSQLPNSDESGYGRGHFVSRIPSMLIGPAHGDLHGRNIIAGVVRGEAEWPAVFDFDNMRPTNLVAWDFAKLELELKCRVFPRLLNTPESLTELQRLLNIPERRPMPSNVDLSADDRRVLARVPRMEIMFEVEKVLRNWSRQISSQSDAIRGDSKRPEIPENTALGRALRIIFRIRCEAALALGYERQGRESQWYDEYHFALMTYGVIVAKWHSTTDHLAWSLLSAGVAAAGLSQLSWPVDPKVNPVAPDFSHIATYQQLLPWAHTCWKQHRGSEPVPMLQAAIKRFPYAVALRQQLALSLMGSAESSDNEAARVEIEELFNLACVFRDHEFLSRFGRIYKDKGDQLLGESMSHQEFLHSKPLAYRHYLAAFQYYETAFQITGNYYPGINAATLALLTGNHEKQKSLAEQILTVCAALPFNAPDQTWILATQGEASLLIGNTEAATHFYQSALQRIPKEETGTINSMQKQLRRLQWALGADVVGAVIEKIGQI